MSPQESIAHYRIVGKLGEGGMGAVYRATDTKLNRDVAIKVLPQAFAEDASRMQRFEREAQFLASLNHPNIAAIYGIEQGAIIMELAEGPTLEERIAEGAIPMPEALQLAAQIADALDAAHEKGVVHRDLKPANIKLTTDGRVKVLDFGLAKAMTDDVAAANPASSPTLTMRATVAGMIMGTAAYMSPEQAAGKPVDKRADIWSFGVVLWEMLTGRRLFDAETISHTLADVLRAAIPFDTLPPEIPSAVRGLIQRCLDRNPRTRLRDIGEARVLFSNPPAPETARAAAPVAVPARKTWAPWTVATLCALAALAAWIARPSAPVAVSRTSILLPEAGGPTQPYFFAFSPDGSRIAYASRQQLYLRSMDSFDAVPLAGTEGASSPFFSPDGLWIGFFAQNRLLKISIHGGAPTLLCPTVGGPNSASWGPDGKIVFSPRGGVNGLLEISENGGTPRALAVLDANKGENAYRSPEVLPDGKNILFTITTDSATSPTQIVALNRSTGEHKLLVESGAYARYSASGHLVYMNGGELIAAAFDPKSLRLDATRVAVLEGVRHVPTGEGWWYLSRTGSILYAPGGLQVLTTRMVWVDMAGAVTPLPAPSRPYGQISLSADGRQVATSLHDGARTDLWTYDIARDSFTRLTFRGINNFPIWSPDGKRLAYFQGGVVSKSADGSGPDERVSDEGSALAWSPDGQWILLRHKGALWMVSASDPRNGRQLAESGPSDNRARFSPDGKWLAYCNDESSRSEVFVRPFPGPGGKWQISTDGGGEPMWDPSGKVLYYRTGTKMMRVEVSTDGSFRSGAPKVVFDAPVAQPVLPIGYAALAPDGKRFLMLQQVDREQPVTQLNFVQNWTTELSRKTPGTK
jgi:eukaryotic-like serine/threonine-protein kinase